MRIIDKNTDFYDYLQNVYPDKTFTFDRTDSFVLTKELMCNHLHIRRLYSYRVSKRYYEFILLQVCNTFWLFLAEITKYDNFDKATDYELELLANWRNYSKPRKLCTLDVIGFNFHINSQLTEKWSEGFSTDRIHKKIDILTKAIDTNDYTLKDHINYHVIYNGNEKIVKNIPLFKACGMANLIDPQDIFLSFEEYFSLEKTESERREPLGTTDNDKIESHGFDLKTSFRGKN